MAEEELLEALGAAVVCTILAHAGPQRSRILANLYKDERTAGLATFPFMEKVYLGRVLRPNEVHHPFARAALLPSGDPKAACDTSLFEAARARQRLSHYSHATPLPPLLFC